MVPSCSRCGFVFFFQLRSRNWASAEKALVSLDYVSFEPALSILRYMQAPKSLSQRARASGHFKTDQSAFDLSPPISLKSTMFNTKAAVTSRKSSFLSMRAHLAWKKMSDWKLCPVLGCQTLKCSSNSWLTVWHILYILIRQKEMSRRYTHVILPEIINCKPEDTSTNLYM